MIRLNDFRRQWADTRDAALAAFEAVGESGWYVLGAEVGAFENDLAALWGLHHCVGVASGLDALEISLRVLGCRAGDKVLTTPVSAFATTLAILKVGAVPVFVDTDRYGLIDLDLCERALASDPEIRHFVPVHLYGSALDPERLRAMRERYGCRIVEDCAQSILARFGGAHSGTAGDMAATSFYPTKNLGGMGDGGAILTQNEEHARLCRAYRDYGQTAKYVHEFIGCNSRLDELQAAIMRRACLPKLEEWTARRREIASHYLAGISHSLLAPVGTPTGAGSCWHLFPLTVPPDRKAEFMRHLATFDIGCAQHYPAAIPDQPAMRSVRFEIAGDLSTARRLCASEVSIPIHPYLTAEEVNAVIEVCNAWECHAVADRAGL